MRIRWSVRAKLAGAVAMVITISFAALAAASAATAHRLASQHPLVALLLPENVTPRWESVDKPNFIADMKRLVPGVQVDVLNALNSTTTQQSQAEAELAKGAKVLVVAPIDQNAAARIVTEANSQGVKVVAYDRLIRNSPLAALSSFGAINIGREQAQWLLAHAKKGAHVAVVNGSPADPNAHGFYKGYMPLLFSAAKAGKIQIVANVWTPGWDPSTAQREMEQILTKTSNGVDAVLSANDGMAGGIIAALQAQGLTGKVPVTGQDASLEGLQRIILGTQGESIYKDMRLEALGAANFAAAILEHKPLRGLFNATEYNGKVHVPTMLEPSMSIDRNNIMTVIKNGFVQKAALCHGIPAGNPPC